MEKSEKLTNSNFKGEKLFVNLIFVENLKTVCWVLLAKKKKKNQFSLKIEIEKGKKLYIHWLYCIFYLYLKQKTLDSTI